MQAHQYFADANEAESWIKEKEPMVLNQDYGKDEDSSEALLKKHEALVSDLEAFGNTIQSLREQAQACRVSMSTQSSKQTITGPRHLLVRAMFCVQRAFGMPSPFLSLHVPKSYYYLTIYISLSKITSNLLYLL